MSDLADLTHHDFTPHTGSTFDLVADDARTVSLELSEVKARDQASSVEGGGRQPFSLLFLARTDAPTLSQHLYHLDHASLGALDLFLVPVGPKDGAMQYEAVFN
jgi:hypothetical protein